MTSPCPSDSLSWVFLLALRQKYALNFITNPMIRMAQVVVERDIIRMGVCLDCIIGRLVGLPRIVNDEGTVVLELE